MNTERTSSSASRLSVNALRFPALASRNFRVFAAWLAAALLLVGLVATASQAGLKPVSSGGTGAVLALAAQLRTARIHANSSLVGGAATSRTPGGRTLLPRTMMHAGAIVKSHAAAASVVPISGGVQTYDVNNPPAAFRPLVGFGSATALNNSSSNPPVYISALTPTNLTPIWSPDEGYLIFSSNRNQTGGLNADATDGVSARFHLWAISVNGGEAFQITTSTGPANGGEFFPTLSGNSNKLAFTSDAQSFGTQNLYVIGFSSAVLTAGVAPSNISDTTVYSSLTLRYGPGIVSGTAVPTEASSSSFTGFTSVQRPTFGTSDGSLIVFSALSVSGTNTGHNHLYFLYQSSGGFSNSLSTSYPGKLTDGPADDTDPTFSPDGQFIAFSSTASTLGANPDNGFGPSPPSAVQDPNASQTLTASPVATRSIFMISGGGSGNGVPFGTTPSKLGTNGRVTIAGTDDYGPAWSNFANQNQYTNPVPSFAYLAFSRATASTTAHDIYYLQVGQGVSSPSTETLTPESNSNLVIHLNTDDNVTSTAPANIYDDVYPAWSPFLSIFSITYSSNRTVTYNNPANSQPTETAVSVAPGGAVTDAQDPTANYSVGSNYAGLLISQVLNLDSPTLLRFSANEVIHVQAAGTLDSNGNSTDPVGGTGNKLAVSGGQKITLTVRLSDREAGIDNTGGPNGGPRVYVQIKDPDSKYQDAQTVEHKVFAKDLQYNGQPNQPLSDVTSGTVNAFIGDGFAGFESGQLPLNKYTYPSYGTPDQTSPAIAQRVFPRGAHGGHYFTPDTNNPESTYVFVGKGAAGTTNPQNPGTDPAQFIPWGPEYESQVVNPQFANGDTTVDNAGPTVATPSNGVIGDYVSPFWLAGVDDQGSFSGGVYSANTGASGLPQQFVPVQTPDGGSTGSFPITVTNGAVQTDRPTAGYTDANGTTHPAEWLQLTPVPTNADGTQDGDANGGVLYTVTWTTPASGSDFYLDVIAYDKAAFPNVPGSAFAGKKSNWRIYDNVGGFSTNQSVGNNDILVVSDYALGQKFAATTFGGRNLNGNLIPKIFGTESYLTDIDVNVLPDSQFAGIPTTPTSYLFHPAIQPFSFGLSTANGLGIGSYLDGIIDDGNRNIDGSSNNVSQRYSIWRILSRGPVPQSVLTSYLPKPVQQPAIIDPAGIGTVAAATVLDASQCVIWLSPYTGDVLADPGTIDDPGNVGQTGVTTPRQSTTSILTSFVQSGGRLCVTGQDVGSTLTQGGTVNNTASTTTGSPNFLPDVLNATLSANSSGITVLAGTNNRITGNPFYDHNSTGFFPTIAGTIGAESISSNANYPYLDNLVLGNADYGDGSLSQLPAITLPGGASIQGQSDVITATNGATTAITYGTGGGGALVYHDDPYNAANTGVLPNGGTGSRVVYAAFGLEGLSEDYFSSACPNPSSNPALDEIIPAVIARNPRIEILHNIVSYLRTGRVSGTITQTAGTGQGAGAGIDGVTVYLRPTGGAPPSRAAFSALTANGGRFTIAGVEAGTYTLVANKAGFQRAVSNSNVSFTVEGDTTATGATLTMTPQQPGNIAGVVQDTADNPISGATVTFTSQDNSVTKTGTSANGSVTGSTTENYFIQNVPVTTYKGTAIGPLNSQGLAEYQPATAPDGQYATGVPVLPSTTTQPVNFTLTAAPASISGTIIDSVTNGPISGAIVTLTKPNSTAVLATVTTGATGAYTFTGIVATATAATFTVSAVAPSYAPSSVTQALQAGNVITGLTIPLTGIPSGNITGTVTDKNTGLPLVGATVTFTLTGGVTQTTTTGANGVYTLNAIPLGTYSGVATGPTTGQAYVPSNPVSVVVTNGVTKTVSFALVPVLSTITGTVLDATTNLPLAGVTITVTTASGGAVATTPATITTDANGNYTATLAPGTYFVTASKANYNGQTSASTVFALSATVNVSFKLTSSTGTLGGLVTDQNGTGLDAGATVTVIPKGQTTGITFTTGATSTTGPDGSPINYSGQIAQGTYTVTVTKGSRTSATQTVTVVGGAFKRLDFTAANGLPALHTFASGIQFVSAPYDYSAIGFDGLFGALNTAAAGTTPNGNRSNVAVWNPLTGAYALDPTAPADTLRLGVGYWVYLKNATPVTAQGVVPTAAYISVALGQGWNQIGVPNPASAGVPISSLLFANGAGGTITFAQASSSTYNLVTRPLYGYSGGSSYQSLTSTGTLAPWQGYWIYVNSAATLEIPTK